MDDLKMNKGSSTTSSGIHVIEINLSTYDSWVLDIGYGSHICTNVHGLKRSRILVKGEVDLRVGNGARVTALAVWTYDLTLANGLILSLKIYYYAPAMSKNIIYVSYLDNNGFEFIIGNNKFSIYLFVDMLHEKSIYNIDTKKFKSNYLNTTYLWHCRLGNVNEKHISILH